MRDLTVIFLPVIWAIVATGIGMLLYRSSKALFTASTTQVRGIRLTGSAAIAAVAFFGIKWATPAATLNVVDPGQVVVSQSALETVAAKADDLEDELVTANGDVATCVSVIDCRERVAGARGKATELTAAIAKLRPAATGAQ